MSGAELALAIVPLVIVMVEHHQTVFRKGKALVLAKSKNDQQLDFFHELHDELALLYMTLNRIRERSRLAGHDVTLEEAIKRALGNEAPHFQTILERIMRSINDLVSERSIALAKENTVSSAYIMHKLSVLTFRKPLARCCLSSNILNSRSIGENLRSRSAVDSASQGTRKAVQ